MTEKGRRTECTSTTVAAAVAYLTMMVGHIPLVICIVDKFVILKVFQ